MQLICTVLYLLQRHYWVEILTLHAQFDRLILEIKKSLIKTAYTNEILLINFACSDTDECQTNTDNCHIAATCRNFIGNFNCTCNSGFRGTGVICTGKY